MTRGFSKAREPTKGSAITRRIEPMRNEVLSFDEERRQKVVPRSPSKPGDACRRGVGRFVPRMKTEKPDRGKRSIELPLSSSLSIPIVDFSDRGI